MISVSDPRELARRGEEIYREKYQQSFEEEHLGKFVAIDVESGKAYVADSPAEAYEAARADSPEGLFHLIRVGFSGAYRVSYTSHVGSDWVFQ